ncbi:zinc finger, CCHC-type containing protein [Tanacetum coccineum]
MKLDEAIQVTCIIRTNHLLLKDFNTPLKHHKEELTLVELGSHLRNLRSPSWCRICEKANGILLLGPSVSIWWCITNFSRYNDRKGKTINQHDKTRLILTRRLNLLVGNVAKLVTLKGIAKVYNVTYVSEAYFMLDDDVAWWVDSELNQFHAMSLVRDADMSIDGLILAFDMDMKVPIDVLKVPPIKSFDKYLSILKEMKDMWFSVLNRSLRVSERAESGFLRKFSEYRAWEVPSFDGLEPQPLLNSTSLDVSPGGVIGPEPPIKPHRPDSSRMKVEMFDDDWGLESKEVSLLGEELSRKAHLLEDKQNPKYLAFGGNTRDLGSFGEETNETTDLHQHLSRLCSQRLETASQDIHDAVTIHPTTDEPKTFDEATKSQDVAFWKEAINDELDSILGNNTWVLADLPPGCKPLGCKWIFQRKLKVDGTIEKFKARLAIQGFRQKSRIDYFNTYAPVARISTIRPMIAMASIHILIIYQMDVKTTFLNGELNEEVYMNQPQGFIMPGNENKVCKLIKSLYGLKQAPK